MAPPKQYTNAELAERVKAQKIAWNKRHGAVLRIAAARWRAAHPEQARETWKRHNAKRQRTPELSAFRSAKNRCSNRRNREWKRYGGRGIEWRFKNYAEALKCLGPRPQGMTLDRINNDGHYEPGNVRWATWIEQAANKRPRPTGLVYRRSGAA